MVQPSDPWVCSGCPRGRLFNQAGACSTIIQEVPIGNDISYPDPWVDEAYNLSMDAWQRGLTSMILRTDN